MARPASVQLLYTRVLGGHSDVVPLWFDAAVLDRYRGAAGTRVMRTNTVGRLKTPHWSIDFGIAETQETATSSSGGVAGGGALVHVSLADALSRIPEGERGHWAAHGVALPLSANFITMQITRGSCVDDGVLRDW